MGLLDLDGKIDWSLLDFFFKRCLVLQSGKWNRSEKVVGRMMVVTFREGLLPKLCDILPW